VVVLPAVVAAGWATALLALFGARSSPITILLAGVVVAFATEFSVLWMARYRAERAAGVAPDAAALTASERVGPAIVASALALVAGFLVLGASPVPMVRGFGLVCGLDLALATGAVLVLLPPMARSWIR
jgi:predicted RND superfamily exporter protein